jgi:hypothetical protein
MRKPRLTANVNSGERCAALTAAKQNIMNEHGGELSDKITVLQAYYFSSLEHTFSRPFTCTERPM